MILLFSWVSSQVVQNLKCKTFCTSYGSANLTAHAARWTMSLNIDHFSEMPEGSVVLERDAFPEFFFATTNIHEILKSNSLVLV